MTTEVARDQQGNILAQNIQKLEIRGLKRTPSSVFSWPAFINTSSTKELEKPIKTIVQVRSTDSVRSVLWTLIKNKIQCVPVYNESTRKYVGFIDMFDLVQYIATAAGHSIVKPDFFQVFKRQPFGDAPVSKILSPLSKDHCASVTESSPLGTLFELTVASNLHRVPVMTKQKVVGMISQTRMVQYLAENVTNFSDLCSKKIMDLNLSGTDNVYTVADNVPSITAFMYMIEKGVRGVAVVNADGQFVDAVNSFDVKGLVHGDFFSDLRQPILRYLSKSRILLGKNLAPVVCTQEETLADALQKMAQEGVSRIFVIDSSRKPIQAISLRDILKLLHATPVAPPSIPTTTTTATTTIETKTADVATADVAPAGAGAQ